MDSATLSDSTNVCQSIALRVLRLVIVLPIEAWLAASSWLSACWIISIVWPCCDSSCSIQLIARLNAAWSPSMLANSSAIKGGDMEGAERTNSANSVTNSLGSSWTTLMNRRAHSSARSC